jgi:hypothetical protein
MDIDSPQPTPRKQTPPDKNVAGLREGALAPCHVEHLIVALEAKELVRDRSARNEVLLSQLEELPSLVEARIRSLRQKVIAANDRAELAHRQVDEIVNSSIWRLLVSAYRSFSDFGARKASGRNYQLVSSDHWRDNSGITVAKASPQVAGSTDWSLRSLTPPRTISTPARSAS